MTRFGPSTWANDYPRSSASRSSVRRYQSASPSFTPTRHVVVGWTSSCSRPRGRGVGSASVHTLVERARTVHQWAYVTVDPDLTNPDGIRFWQAVGFTPVHRCPGTPERAPYLLMQRSLDLETV